MAKKLVQPLKWHGGKHYLAKQILALMPPHVHYVEPYFGGGSVLLEKDPHNVSEVVNDINGNLVNFWRVLRAPEHFAKFVRVIQATPFSQELWEESGAVLETEAPDEIDVDRAIQFFIRCRQSRAGKFDAFATLSKRRTRRGMNEQASAWLSAVEGLPEAAQRMQRVAIYREDAVKVIQKEDSTSTLFYLDPPYLHETRVTTQDYAHEMNYEDHQRLLQTIKQVEGSVILSGYPSELYQTELQDWRRHQIEIDNKASSKSQKPIKTECLWMNFQGE